MPLSFDDPRVASLHRIASGSAVSGLSLLPIIQLAAQVPLGLGLVAGKFASIHNTQVHDREALIRHRAEHIGKSNYTPVKLKEKLRLRW